MPPRCGGEVDGVISEQRVEMHGWAGGGGETRRTEHLKVHLILCMSQKNPLTVTAPLTMRLARVWLRLASSALWLFLK